MPPRDATASGHQSVIVADEKQSQTESFFSFADPGQVPWWSLVIVGILGCLTLASIIIIAVEAKARQPPLAFTAIERAQCPYVSPLLLVIAYTAWLPTCRATSYGHVAPCVSQVDCAWLAGACASDDVVGQLRCEVPTLGITSMDEAGRVQKVCGMVHSAASQVSGSSGGFCTTPQTQCAVCAAGGACRDGLSGCVPSGLCTGPNASDAWMCVHA